MEDGAAAQFLSGRPPLKHQSLDRSPRPPIRDEFPADVIRIVSLRAAGHCANPDCGATTTGPQIDAAKALNVGVAAHITAASPGGPRHDPSLASEQRRSVDNAIWLCQTCSKLVDNDPLRFTEVVLRGWKTAVEAAALDAVGKAALKAAEPLGSVRAQLAAITAPVVTVRAYGRRIADPRPLEASYVKSAECRIEELGDSFVRLLDIGSGVIYSVHLDDIRVTYDDRKHRPLLEVRTQ